MNHTETQTNLSALVIDDEPQIRRLLTITLEASGYGVSTVGTGHEAITIAAQRRHDIIILDLGLPDMSGMEVLKQIREWSQTPILVLSVQDGEADKVEALDKGADDYVTKPFKTGEFLARLRATLRRADTGKLEKPIFTAGELTVNFATRRVTLGGAPVKLTATEYALVRLFVQQADRVLPHRYILREVWGPEHESHTEYLRVYLTRLREKLEKEPAKPVLFLTEPGVGYRFVAS